MNRKKWTRSEKILWLAPAMFIGFVGLIAYAPRFSRSIEALLESSGLGSRAGERQLRCQSNERLMGLGVLQYVSDYDGKFPPVRVGGAIYGWADALQPYIWGVKLYHCPNNSGSFSPSALTFIKPSSCGYTDYFYNARLSQRHLMDLNNPAQTILFGEGTSSDARSAKWSLPPQWVSRTNSPARLHFAFGSATQSGANYAFADGHVKWFVPQKIGTGPTLVNSNVNRSAALGGAPTFALR